MNQALQDLGEFIASALPDDVTGISQPSEELVVTVKPASIARVLLFLRDDEQCLFKQLMDICGVDYPEREQRFEVVYNLLSLKHNQRVRVKLNTDEDTPVPTVIGVFSTAGWFER